MYHYMHYKSVYYKGMVSILVVVTSLGFILGLTSGGCQSLYMS